MLESTEIKRNSRRFLALTGLTVKEFKVLLPSFTEVYQEQYAGPKTLACRKRKRQAGGGRTGQLATPERKWLFILVYQKTYPLQVVLGELFGLSQSSANEWRHRLLPVVREALRRLGVLPERNGRKFAQAERQHAESADYIIDGTERRRQRPKNSENKACIIVARKKRTPTKTYSLRPHAPSAWAT
jgi:cytochrome P450